MLKATRNKRGAHQASKTQTTPFGSLTDIGCLRDHNEDNLVVAPPLFAVADGMGGHAAGEVASEIAVDTLVEHAPPYPDGEGLSQAVRRANQEVIRAAFDGRGRSGMGTTLTAAMVEGERLVIAQVGDSRAYLLHKNTLQQITRDHSLMADLIEAGQITPEEARTHPYRSKITRAMGSDPNLYPDIFELNVEAGDRLLICSDGLSGMLRDEEIEQILIRVKDPQRCSAQLVDGAIAAGGHDNITVIVVDVLGFSEIQQRKTIRKSFVSIAVIIALFIAIIAGAVMMLNTYLNTVAFLTIEDDKVVVYQGVPGTALGLSFSEYLYTSEVSADSLQPGTISNLEEGIMVDSLEEADILIAAYESLIQQNSSQSDTDEESSEQEEV